MLKIYSPEGTPPLMSSAGRCYLLLEELGLEYESVGLTFSKGEHKGPEYLELNPNGKIPCINDDGFVLWESMAINEYLCNKHKPELLGANLQDKANVSKWNYWYLVEYQPNIVQILIQTRFTPEEKRNPEVIENAKKKMMALNTLLDKELEGKEFLVGDSYTLADLHISLGVGICFMFQIDMSGVPNLAKYLQKMSARPAFQKLQKTHK